MGCPTIPLSCLDPSLIFAGVYNPHCGGFADPSNFQAEQAIIGSQFDELIQNYGVEIGYQVNTFDMGAMNSAYGEHTTMYWTDPVTIKMYLQMEEQSPMYSLAGFDSSDTITGYLHIKTFTALFSSLSVWNALNMPIEPKSQDKVIIYPFGCNRANGRGAKIFEVTEATDQDVGEINPLMGHYVWRIKGVRSEFNSATNEPRENVNNQIADNTFFGKLSSSLFPTLTGQEKAYDQNADETVKTQVFPPSTSGNNGSNYGNYY
jgi:hypothetical protein